MHLLGLHLARSLTAVTALCCISWVHCIADDEDIFDFIVVGGGTSGCVVASRLSENPSFKVLMLEAGPAIPDPMLDIPALAEHVSQGGPNGDYVKFYHSVPQMNAGRDHGGLFRYWTGNTLGGGSAVNMMMANRGSSYDYDNWARITGDESWNYKNMLKYFIKMEDYLGEYPSNQHGQGGPIPIGMTKYSPGEDFWMEAGRQLGYPTKVDPNGPQRISFTTAEAIKHFGHRVSAYSGYIKPIINERPNLKVIIGAFVTKLQFQVNRAVGVHFKDVYGQMHFVRVQREVILSAGVLNSPAILMRSGIGPREILMENRINPVTFLPVGENFHDHVMIRIDFIVGNDSLLYVEKRDLNPETWKIYEETGDGPYSMSGPTVQYIARSPRNRREPNESDQWANLQGLMVFGSIGTEYYPFPSEEIRAEMAPGEGSAMIYPLLTRPRSRGTVKLNTSNIEADPIFDYQFFSHPQDVTDLIHSIKISLDVIEKTPGFQRIGARFPRNLFPSCKHIKPRTDEYWKCVIRQAASGLERGAGTCRMGRGVEDLQAVVDNKLKVINVQNVRVADTSIEPRSVNANTMLSAFVIGEKAADMILSSHTT